MARDRRSPRTTTAGPGRTTKRPRAGSRASAAEPAAIEPAPRPSLPVLRRGLGMTRRAMALIVVLVVLVLSYASSLRIYLGQQHELAVAQQQIRERSDRIADLEAEARRWNDPAYVKAQARERLGWVMPGEVGYRVIGADGEPIGGGVTIESQETLPAGEHDPMWWDRLWGSLRTADAPERRVTTR